MRRIAHTLTVLRHWEKKAGTSSSGLAQGLMFQARRLRIRLSWSFTQAVLAGRYDGEANELLRDLASEISDRGYLSLLYSLYDLGERTRQQETSRRLSARTKRRTSLEEKMQQAHPARYRRLKEALCEEARLRGLDLPESMLRDHCHIFRQHFDWSTAPRLKKLLALSETDFYRLMCQFASALAIAADGWKNGNRFDWKRFGYAGFDRSDYRAFLGERRRHLDSLGLAHDADSETIRRQFKALAKQHHPDLGGNPERMRELNEAYSALMQNPFDSPKQTR